MTTQAVTLAYAAWPKIPSILGICHHHWGRDMVTDAHRARDRPMVLAHEAGGRRLSRMVAELNQRLATHYGPVTFNEAPAPWRVSAPLFDALRARVRTG